MQILEVAQLFGQQPARRSEPHALGLSPDVELPHRRRDGAVPGAPAGHLLQHGPSLQQVIRPLPLPRLRTSRAGGAVGSGALGGGSGSGWRGCGRGRGRGDRGPRRSPRRRPPGATHVVAHVGLVVLRGVRLARGASPPPDERQASAEAHLQMRGVDGEHPVAELERLLGVVAFERAGREVPGTKDRQVVVVPLHRIREDLALADEVQGRPVLDGRALPTALPEEPVALLV
mmetsp:Transcript_110852/g.353222  ORF Transcript_110852/g.353222 Transcript_110852/m.353222 type:complete len:231 (-) Transcript_110852:520-1212(-)